MKIVLILLLIVISFARELEKSRRSCGPPKVAYIHNGANWTTTSIPFKNPGLNSTDWEIFRKYECVSKRSLVKARSRRHNEELEKKYLWAKDLRELLAQSWKDKSFREAFVKEEVKKMGYPQEILDQLLLDSGVPEFTFGCGISGEVNANIRFKYPERYNVTQCEDMGIPLTTETNGITPPPPYAYEFYNIPSLWTYESQNATYHINESLCVKINETVLCPTNARKESICSVNNIDGCSKQTITNDPESPSTAYVRILPGGVAVYGTFQREYDLHETFTSTEIKPSSISTDLYYFSHDDEIR